MLSPGQLWGLRFMALGAVLVIAALIGGAVLLVGGGDEEDSGSGGETPASRLTESVRSKRLGLSVLYPPEWQRRNKGRDLVQLKSPNRCATISFSSPTSADQAGTFRDEAVAAVRGSLAKVRVRNLPPAKSEGQTTSGAVIAGRTKGGGTAAVRLTVTAASQLAHLTSVFFREPPCEEVASDIELILSSIEYTR